MRYIDCFENEERRRAVISAYALLEYARHARDGSNVIGVLRETHRQISLVSPSVYFANDKALGDTTEFLMYVKNKVVLY